jgi:uncharacterized protein YjbI with pentapeptide repeats
MKFEHMAMAESQFIDVNLKSSRFDNVNLTDASFHNIALIGVSFDYVNLKDASITRAGIEGMTIRGVLVTELIAAYEQLHGKLPPHDEDCH